MKHGVFCLDEGIDDVLYEGVKEMKERNWSVAGRGSLRLNFGWKLIISILFVLLIVGCAGLKPVEDTTIERIVNAAGFSKEQIYDGTKIWIAQNFRSAKAVLEYENKEDGTIIGNGSIPYPRRMVDAKVPFTMRVDIKEGKFRLTFTNLQVSWDAHYSVWSGARPAGERPMNQEEFNLTKVELLKFGDEILASLQKDKHKSDW